MAATFDVVVLSQRLGSRGARRLEVVRTHGRVLSLTLCVAIGVCSKGFRASYGSAAVDLQSSNPMATRRVSRVLLRAVLLVLPVAASAIVALFKVDRRTLAPALFMPACSACARGVGASRTARNGFTAYTIF